MEKYIYFSNSTQIVKLVSWITEINELFQDILIYWDAPVLLMLKTVFAA